MPGPRRRHRSVDMLDLGPGRMLPRHAGAASSALLAYARRPNANDVPAGAPFDRSPRQLRPPPRQLRQRLDQRAARGWAWTTANRRRGGGGRGAGAASRRRRRRVSISVAGPAGQRPGPAGVDRRAGLGVAAQQIAGRWPHPGGSHARRHRHPPTATPAAARSGTRAPSLMVKAGALMEALAQERVATSARLTELIDEPVSSVYRMLAPRWPISAGWNKSDTAAPTGSAANCSRWPATSPRHSDIRRAALPVLERIHEATGETTFLCVRHGTRAVCIERIDGVRVNSRVLGWADHCPCTSAQHPGHCWPSKTARGGRSTPPSPHHREDLGHDILPFGALRRTRGQSAPPDSSSATTPSPPASPRSVRPSSTAAARSRPRCRSAVCATAFWPPPRIDDRSPTWSATVRRTLELPRLSKAHQGTRRGSATGCPDILTFGPATCKNMDTLSTEW